MYLYPDMCYWDVFLASVACGSVATEMSRIIFHYFESYYMSTGGHMYVYILAICCINCHSLERKVARCAFIYMVLMFSM